MNFINQLENILNNLEINQNLSVKYKGKDWSVRQRKKDTYQNPQFFNEDLANILYSAAYCQANQAKPEGSNHNSPNWLQEQKDFVQTLSRANQSKGKANEGWLNVQAENDGTIYAKKDRFYRLLKPGQYLYQQSPVQLGLGHREIKVANEREGLHNGFYYAYGDKHEADQNTFAVRVYFNLYPKGAAKWIQLITEQFNHYQIPFIAKCLAHPDLFDRADTAVLYLNKADYNFAANLLPAIIQELDSVLADAIPLFTKRMAKGVAFAESPPVTHESFGTSRCQILANIIASLVQNNVPKSAWLGSITKTFISLNFKMDALYLNPGSQYPYRKLAA
jgi:hypothetical protein